jgi:tRNA threonylcarbamoyladenosine biosynthesis protein TsaE
MQEQIYKSKSEKDTIKIGFDFAKELKLGDVVALYGELGAGKTEFIKGLCHALSVEQMVTSPTFTIMNSYTGKINHNEVSIYHVDLYRIKNVTELDQIGFDECIHSKNDIKLIEWADKAGNRLSKVDYTVRFELDEDNENVRQISIKNELV